MPLLLLLLLPFFSRADDDGGGGGRTYWLEEPLTVGATLGFPNHVFSLSAGSGSGADRNVDYSPPQAMDLTLVLGFGAFQLSYKFPLPQADYSKATYGKLLGYSDFRFEWGRNLWAASFYHQSYSGFYTDLNGNTGSFARIGGGSSDSASSSSATASTPLNIEKRPDIHTHHYGVIGWHALPLKGEAPGQAFQISFDFLAGKPTPGFNLDLPHYVFYDRSEIEGGTQLVPASKTTNFSARSRALRAVDAHTAGAGVGLATSYVFESAKWLLDLLLTYGGGVQRQKTTFTGVDTVWNTRYADNVNFRLGTQYRGESNNAGLHLWANVTGARVVDNDDVRVSSSNMALDFSWATQF